MYNVADIKYPKTALFIAGSIGAFGFPPVYALPLFVASLIFAVVLCDKAETYRKASMIAYVFGFGFYTSAFYWIANALLVDLKAFGLFYPIALLAPGLFFGFFFVPSFLAWHFFKNTNVWLKILGFSSVFVLFEYVRSFLFTGFPWNMLGTMFAFSDVLIQTASLIGTYGLSFLLLILVFCFYAALKKHYKSAAIVFVGILSVMILFGELRILRYDDSSAEITIRLVQPSIPQSLKWEEQALEDNLADYINLSRQEGFENVKLVVWGETATAFNPADSLYYKMLIREAVPSKGYLITGVLRYDKDADKLYNSASVINDKGETVAFYDKNHLVPFGEYLPFRKFWPKWMKPIASQIADFSKGEKYKKIELPDLPPFSVLICYEIIFPDEVLNRKDKPSFLVVLSNDGWYGKSFGPYQHFVAAKMRAVEEGITIIRSANNGISAMIDPLGQIIYRPLGLNKRGVIDVAPPIGMSMGTIYSSGVKIFIQLIMLLIFCGCLVIKTFNLGNTLKN